MPILAYVAAMRLTRAITCALAAAALALTGCSDDGDDLDPEAEEELLEGAILTLDDLPDGFEEADADEDDGSNEAIEECGEEADLDEDAIDDASIAHVGPVTFELGAEDTFGSLEAELRTIDPTDPAEAVFDAIGEDDFRDCVLEAFEESVEDEGQTVEDAEIDEADPPADGDRAGGLELTGDISGFEFEGQVLAVLRGNHLISLEVTSLGGAIDEDVVEDAFEAMIERLEEGD